MPPQYTMPLEHLFFQFRVIATCNHKHQKNISQLEKIQHCYTCWVGTGQQKEFTHFNMSVLYGERILSVGELTVHPTSYHLWHNQSIQLFQASLPLFCIISISYYYY